MRTVIRLLCASTFVSLLVRFVHFVCRFRWPHDAPRRPAGTGTHTYMPGAPRTGGGTRRRPMNAGGHAGQMDRLDIRVRRTKARDGARVSSGNRSGLRPAASAAVAGASSSLSVRICTDCRGPFSCPFSRADEKTSSPRREPWRIERSERLIGSRPDTRRFTLDDVTISYMEAPSPCRPALLISRLVSLFRHNEHLTVDRTDPLLSVLAAAYSSLYGNRLAPIVSACFPF